MAAGRQRLKTIFSRWCRNSRVAATQLCRCKRATALTHFRKGKKKKKRKQFCILVVVGSVINTCLLAQILRQGLQDVGFAAANSTLQRQSASRFCSRKLTCGAKDSRLQDYGLILGLNKNQKNLVLHKTG